MLTQHKKRKAHELSQIKKTGRLSVLSFLSPAVYHGAALLSVRVLDREDQKFIGEMSSSQKIIIIIKNTEYRLTNTDFRS